MAGALSQQPKRRSLQLKPPSVLLYINGHSPSQSLPLTYSVFGSVRPMVMADNPEHPLLGGLTLLHEPPPSVLLYSNWSTVEAPSVRAVKAYRMFGRRKSMARERV